MADYWLLALRLPRECAVLPKRINIPNQDLELPKACGQGRSLGEALSGGRRRVRCSSGYELAPLRAGNRPRIDPGLNRKSPLV
jgi:hypothetical protein